MQWETTRKETVTKREVRKLKKVNGEVVEDVYNSTIDRNFDNGSGALLSVSPPDGRTVSDREDLRNYEGKPSSNTESELNFMDTTRRTSVGSERTGVNSRTERRSGATPSTPTKKSSVTLQLGTRRTSSSSTSSNKGKDSQATYNISMRLGQVNGSGTDGNVYIQLFGEEGNTAKIQLRQSGDMSNKFETGELYKFTVATVDIGKIERIKLTHDHMNYGSGFFVEDVEIDVPQHDEGYKFPCNCWLSQDPKEEYVSKTIQRDLNARPPQPNQRYTISVKLGAVENPLIKLFVRLVGDKGESSKIVLRPAGNQLEKFEDGKVYKFTVEMPGVGQVEKVHVGRDGHDESQGKGVYIEDIEVEVENRETLFFPCDTWLDDQTVESGREMAFLPGPRPESSMVSENAHTVSVRLGEVHNPDVNLYICLIGTKGETPKVSLRPESLTLERNKTYKFTLAPTMDLGRIEKIRLGQDCRGFGNGLFVEEVEVVPPQGPPVLFPCEVWLAEDVDDGETERILYPGWTMPKKENTWYDLVFKTGDMPYAGTDANVSLQIFGEKGKTERIMLRQQKGKTLQRFDRGRRDKFAVQTMDVGKVERIRLSHDNQGENPEWYLDNLSIEAPNPQGGNDKYYFPCNTWLKGPERGRRVVLELYPVSPQTKQKPQTIYAVNFRVGELTDPRTEFYLVLHGPRGKSGKIVLAPDDSGKFVPGQDYSVNLKADDVGKIDTIEVGQDKGNPLFVEEVEICAAEEEPVVFPLHCWVDDTEKEFQPGEIITPVIQENVQLAPDPQPEPEPAIREYTISYRLGEVSDPRTELFVKLYGDRGESGRLLLEPADDSRGLEEGKLYRVLVQIPDIGEIQKIHIGHGNRGPGRGLFVEEVEVSAEEGESVIFPCRCWLAEDKGDGIVDRVLIPGETLEPAPESVTYNVAFETGDLPFSGTDANVFMEIYGDNGDTGKIEFNRDDNKSAGRFERGRTDKFAVETADIGKLSRIRVGHDNVGRSPEWFLKQITIDVPQRNENYVFPYNNWIAGEDVDLDPVDEKSKGDIYTIEMKLGEVYDPVSPIHVQLIGEKGESGPIQIKPGYGPNDRFERNKTYKVVAKVADIGKTKDVIVRQNETSTGVYIETIEIINSRGESIVKPVKSWTTKKKEEETIGLGDEHDREGTERTVNDVAYEIAFKTGDKQNAGTDADVHFQLIGDQGETEKISLRDDAMTHFERGSTDKFRVETKDVGEIKKLRVGRDNRGTHPDWLLETVTVDDLQRNERYIFNCNSWLLGRDPEIEFEPGAPATDDGRRDVHYNVTLTTGNEPNAGTDANVFLQLFGELGQTEPFKLREPGDNKRFSRGRTDKFSILSKDVGKLNKVRVTRDTQGKEPGWLLEKMIIFIPETNEEYLFQCNRWIDKNEPEFEFAPGPVTDETEDNLYTVVVKVDDVMDPMSNPYYQIYGVKGKTNKIYLRDGYSPQHQFKKGDTYKISVKCPDVGKVTKLIVADDSGNTGKCMYLEEITVTNNNGDKTVFPSNCWLENDSKGNPVILELIPGEPASQDGVSYRMIVKTADRVKAGTDANVFFQFNGERGSTPKILLQDETGAFKRFESGRADKFIVQTVDVGKLDSMVIGHDNQGDDPSWFLEEVEVDILETGDHYLFPCGRWLRAENGKNEAETILYPGEGRSLVDEGNIGIANENLVGTEVDAPFGSSEDMEYEVEFKTGEESGAGTDSNVFFQLFGENGETKRIELRQDKNARRFQKGNIDRFRFREGDIGKLERISVAHDGSGKSTQWFLEEVVVYVIDRNERYIFKCNRWIGGKGADLAVDSWGFYQMVGREPDIPDLLEYMQSGDLTKGIHAAVYLQHLCYQDETVKARVRKLGGIEILVRLLDHSHERVRYAAACVLRNISYSTTTDENKIRIAECGGILALIRMLQRTQEEQERQVILTIIRNLSGVQALRLMILRECLHILVIIILIPYSGWDKLKALREPAAREKEWSAVLEHVTRIIRNLSSSGTDAREYLREEEALIDCLVWIIRVSVKSRYYENRCLENSVCTLRNLSYRLESELDRDAYKDADLDMDSKAVKEQQSQGCFAGCGGRKKKKTSGKKPIDRQKEGVAGVELLWQPNTVGQYFLLLKESNNMDTLEGSAGAIHNMTACSWNWSIKIRGDSRKAQIVPHLVRLLKRDYDPAIRAAAICLRNLAVDPENKKIIGEKAIKDLAYRLPGVNERNPLVKEPTIASLMCAIYQLCIRNEKNARLLQKTDGIRKIVRIARSTDTYSPKLVKTANQVLASLWSSRVLTEKIKKEGWEYNDDMSAEYRTAPLDFEATSLPRSPGEDSRVESDRGPPNGYSRYRTDSFEQPRRDSESYNRPRVGEARTRQGSERSNSVRDRLPSNQSDNRSAFNSAYVRGSGEGMDTADDFSESGERGRSWGESLNRAPPAYTSQSSFENAGYDRTPKGKRGTMSRESLEMEEYAPRSFTSPARKSSSSSSQRDYNENQKAVSETPVMMNGKGSFRRGEGTGEKNDKHLWV